MRRPPTVAPPGYPTAADHNITLVKNARLAGTDGRLGIVKKHVHPAVPRRGDQGRS